MVVDFRLWLLLIEHDLNPADYDALFDRERQRLLSRISNPGEQARLLPPFCAHGRTAGWGDRGSHD